VYGLVGLAAHKAIEANPSVDPAAAAGEHRARLVAGFLSTAQYLLQTHSAAPTTLTPFRPTPSTYTHTHTRTHPTAIAAHSVLSTLFPWAQSSAYDTLLKRQLNATTPAVPKATRQAIAAAAAALVKGAIGGASADYPDFKFAPNGTVYAYQQVPGQKYVLYPQVANATPLIATPARLEAIALNKDEKKGPVFAPPKPRGVDYETTYLLGSANSTERTKYDTESAPFWADGANTSAIGGHWLNISLAVSPAASA